MPECFFFDIENDEETIQDEEGVEAGGADEALSEARSVIAEMIDEIALGISGQVWTLVVRNASGRVVGRLPIGR